MVSTAVTSAVRRMCRVSTGMSKRGIGRKPIVQVCTQDLVGDEDFRAPVAARPRSGLAPLGFYVHVVRDRSRSMPQDGGERASEADDLAVEFTDAGLKTFAFDAPGHLGFEPR